MENQYNTYLCKDGRMRIYNKATKKVTSYPRFIVEQNIGRPLFPNEDVHHKDENPLNNNINNLEITIHGEHQRQHNPPIYFDKEMICPNCKKSFIWTVKQQRTYSANIKRNKCKSGPFCSRHCAGQYTYVPHHK